MPTDSADAKFNAFVDGVWKEMPKIIENLTTATVRAAENIQKFVFECQISLTVNPDREIIKFLQAQGIYTNNYRKFHKMRMKRSRKS